jgi:hypothetical protein
MSTPARWSRQTPTATPPAMPPQMPRPPFHTANGPHQWSGTSFQLVARKYSRPPMIPAGNPHSAHSCTMAREPPCASQRRVVTATAASTAST